MTLVLVMAFNILVALGLGFVVGRIYQIRRDELETTRRATVHRPHSASLSSTTKLPEPFTTRRLQ